MSNDYLHHPMEDVTFECFEDEDLGYDDSEKVSCGCKFCCCLNRVDFHQEICPDCLVGAHQG